MHPGLDGDSGNLRIIDREPHMDLVRATGGTRQELLLWVVAIYRRKGEAVKSEEHGASAASLPRKEKGAVDDPFWRERSANLRDARVLAPGNAALVNLYAEHEAGSGSTTMMEIYNNIYILYTLSTRRHRMW